MSIAEALRTARGLSPDAYLFATVARMHLGNAAAAVISVLISSGRLTLKQLVSKTKMPAKLTKTTLVSLIQLMCVQYWREDSSDKVYYSFNADGIWTLLQAGEIITWIRREYGEQEAETMQNILEVGHICVEDYLSSFNAQQQYDRVMILTRLYNDKWLRRIQQFNFYPIVDIWEQKYTETLRAIPRNNSTSEIKRVAEAKEQTKRKITELYLSNEDSSAAYTVQDGIKKLDSSITLAFNSTRYSKHLRSEALTHLAEYKVGTLTSKVYEAALKFVEANSPDLDPLYLSVPGWCVDPDEVKAYKNSIENKLVDDKKIVFTVRDIAKLLPKEVDLTNSILTHNFLKPNKRPSELENGSSKKIKLEDGGVAEVSEHIDHNDTGTHSLILHHLKALCSASNIAFLHETTPSTFTIPYTALVHELKKYHYDLLIKITLGPEAFRVFRALKSLKLADEKALSNAVLLKEKTLRNELFNMVKLNIIEIQEVPRSADRAASKTFFLFRHKQQSAYSFLVNSLTFSMAELLQGIIDFKAEHRILLAKCEREDVKGNEEALLLSSELKTLRSLQEREIASLGKVSRLKQLRQVFNA